MKKLSNPTLIFIRHGEVKDNTKNVLPGWHDEPLDQTGAAEAAATAKKIDEYPIAHIYTSDMKRAAKTAEIIAKATGAAVTKTSALRPWNYGDIAGQPNNKENQRKLEELQSQPDVPAPGGESFNDYSEGRFFPAVKKLRAYAESHPNAATVVVTHSRNLLALKHALGDKSQPISVDKNEFENAGAWKVEFNPKFANGFKLSEI